MAKLLGVDRSRSAIDWAIAEQNRGSDRLQFRRRSYAARSVQLFGSQYLTIRSPSVLNITLVPRCSRICLVVRLIMPWRFPDWANSTFPVAVTLKRFFAPDLVLILGIWLSSARTRRAGAVHR